MEKIVSPPDLLLDIHDRVLLDVRAPSEYEQGHIPTAVSFPLFTDEERAQVGTVYKKNGKEQAVLLGLKIVGPKLAGFVEQAASLSPHKRVAVHCWRGGMRSRSMAWLLQTAGFDVIVLDGGYKHYRKYIIDQFGSLPLKLIVLGGKTGAGKTKILKELLNVGEQIIDLEHLAKHKGSAFGWIGEEEQPRSEQFENDLFEVFRKIDRNRRVWIENESRCIGKVTIPEGLWKQMKAAPVVQVDLSVEMRVENLLEDYAVYPVTELEQAFHKIAKKLGGLHLKNALDALNIGDFSKATEIALWYYDKTYQHGLDKPTTNIFQILDCEVRSPKNIAEKCIDLNIYI